MRSITRKMMIECYNNPFERNWKILSSNWKLSEDFMNDFRNNIHWMYVSRFQTLSEPFIKKYQNKVHWYNISQYQCLSESFIEEFKDKVKWNEISKFQSLSIKFINKFKNNINWNYYLLNLQVVPYLVYDNRDKLITYSDNYHRILKKYIILKRAQVTTLNDMLKNILPIECRKYIATYL